ncbi:molybdenum cofactor guanylyltransferase [Sphingomonas sp. PB4P5]|uniref:molybdenum cofactor guanylyltransferase n=1 Tax=Parasphingomonas puruogangriensis TaxID=3096155 RepID=UPI002FC64A13
MTLLGAILAGGEARRFGSDKALAVLEGRTLIDHAAIILRSKCDDVVVCGRQAAPDDLTTIADLPAARLGPLGGLCGALHYAKANNYGAVLTIGCDTPAMPLALLDALIAMSSACYVRQMPIVGWWPVALAAPLAQHLAGYSDRSVRGWGALIGAAAIDAAGDIPNINRPDDLARLAAARTP